MPRTPRVVDIGVMLSLVVGTALAVRWGGGARIVGDAWITAVAAGVTGLVFGLPIVAFTLERGRTSAAWLTGLGAVAGALPLALLGLSGMMGLRFRAGDWERVTWALERGMPLPGVGILYWPRYLRLEVQTVLIGLACGLMFWLLMIRARPETRAINGLLALFVLGILMTVATWLR